MNKREVHWNRFSTWEVKTKTMDKGAPQKRCCCPTCFQRRPFQRRPQKFLRQHVLCSHKPEGKFSGWLVASAKSKHHESKGLDTTPTCSPCASVSKLNAGQHSASHRLVHLQSIQTVTAVQTVHTTSVPSSLNLVVSHTRSLNAGLAQETKVHSCS